MVYGRQCLSLLTNLFSFVRSTLILTQPPGLGTTTIPEHQSVGSSTLDMTPNSSILSNSACNLGSSGIGTLLGVLFEYGGAFSHS